MANGKDSENNSVELSNIRIGLKREFQFALKAQSEICGSLGRTRSRKAENNVGSGHVSAPPKNKRMKTYESKRKKKEEKIVVMDLSKELEVLSEEEAKSDVVDVVVDEAKIDEREMPISQGELMSQDVVMEKHDESKNSSKQAVVNELEVLMNGKEEPKKAEEEEGNNIECDKLSMHVEGHKYEEMDQRKENESERVAMDVEEVKKDVVVNGLVETPLKVKESAKVVNGVIETPLRRFTRSMLQPKANPDKISAGKESDVKEGDDGEVANPLAGTPIKQEIAINSMRVRGRKFSPKLKDFLESGILEGMPVTYIRGSKVSGPGVKGLQGVIKGSGILCYCNICKGIEVVTPTIFELHAGSANKRPPEYIYLENGNTLRDVMNACKDSPLQMLEETVKKMVGCLPLKKSSFCLSCRGSTTESGIGKSVLLCNSCVELKESQAASAAVADSSDVPDGSPETNSAMKVTDSASNGNSSKIKSKGRITRKDLRLHKLVFEEGGLADGTELGYFSRGQRLLVGYKKGFGIFCSCCNSEISPSLFEAHAGWASRRKPFQNIYTSNGVSLHEFSVTLSRDRRFSTKENDDLCGICMDGGDLLCCDSCPRAFHTDCVSLPKIPTGAWYCRYCQNAYQNERFVERNANAIAAGRVAGVDPIAQITDRCIRIVETLDTELGGCVICRGRDFCKSRFGRRTVILCDQCEREYHVGCLKDHGMEDLQELPKGKWLCCPECKKINLALQKLIDRGEEKLPDSSLSAIQKKHEESASESGANVDVRWRVLRGNNMDSSDGTRVLLSKAVSIFHDRFDPIIESASKLDLIPSMVYGRSHKGQDYHGMYCAILTVNQVVVSAAIFRIFGPAVAEIPLVATSTECQGQGYFQCLFSCIEKLLGFLNVKDLVLPSAKEAQSIWTSKFGFKDLSWDELNKFRNQYPLMVFQGTSMLQKPVPECRIVSKTVNE